MVLGLLLYCWMFLAYLRCFRVWGLGGFSVSGFGGFTVGGCRVWGCRVWGFSVWGVLEIWALGFGLVRVFYARSQNYRHIF